MTAPRSVGTVVVLAILVLTVGCNSLDTGQSPTTTGTVTPVPVPTISPTATPVPTVVPGIERSGEIRPGTVIDRHQRALATHSYTLTIRRTVVAIDGTAGENPTAAGNRTASENRTGAGGTLRETYVRAWVARNRTAYRLVQFVNVSRPTRITTASEPAVDLWYNGSAAFYRVTDSTGTPYVRARGVESEALSDPTFPLVYREFLGVGRFRPLTRASGLQATRFVAVAVNRSAIDPPPPYGRPRNVTARFVVTPEGIVRRTRLSYTASGDGERVRVRETTAITAIDATTVPVPSWVPGDDRR